MKFSKRDWSLGVSVDLKYDAFWNLLSETGFFNQHEYNIVMWLRVYGLELICYGLNPASASWNLGSNEWDK